MKAWCCPAGKLFAAMHSVDADGLIQFVFPAERLPSHTQVPSAHPACDVVPSHSDSVLNPSLARLSSDCGLSRGVSTILFTRRCCWPATRGVACSTPGRSTSALWCWTTWGGRTFTWTSSGALLPEEAPSPAECDVGRQNLHCLIGTALWPCMLTLITPSKSDPPLHKPRACWTACVRTVLLQALVQHGRSRPDLCSCSR